MAVDGPIEQALDGLPAISLEALDDRASLLRRTDTKYVLTEAQLRRLMDSLADELEVLEIKGRRSFRYQSVYFDTPDLRCFRDHIQDRIPRFKTRTRLYRDTSRCVFEVKLKVEKGETDKRQVEHEADAADVADAAAAQCLKDALDDAGIPPSEERLSSSLRTGFMRVTLAPRGGSERITCDFGIRLERRGGSTAEIRDGLVLVESKSEGGNGPADRSLEAMGVDSVSLSKYRVGIALLAEEADDPDLPTTTTELFSVREEP